jgi:hypothetical protein
MDEKLVLMAGKVEECVTMAKWTELGKELCQQKGTMAAVQAAVEAVARQVAEVRPQQCGQWLGWAPAPQVAAHHSTAKQEGEKMWRE